MKMSKIESDFQISLKDKKTNTGLGKIYSYGSIKRLIINKL